MVCDALLKMPLAVDHQGDQEASVGAQPPAPALHNARLHSSHTSDLQ